MTSTSPEQAPPAVGQTEPSRAKRLRKTPEERRGEIIEAAVRLIGERGYNGVSVQDVADAVGISKQGVLRHVGSKDGMMSMLYREVYNASATPDDFLRSGLPGSTPDDLRYPAYLRFLVRHNATRRMMVQLFTMLEAESFNPGHPLYDEFRNRRDGIWLTHSQYPWRIPPQIGGWKHMRPTVRKAMEVMDGIQIRWLRDPPIDLVEEWAEFEPLLFPSPIWDDYR
ncbi:TetR family transcriptional regulator [Bifidobacterium pullorum subsp. gallinarum]|uniref:TetR family transcriptional regulator n=1 Tax=Bifidobacterium pullorum subsp. gallinarum TaxID=78344 RepID=A0A087AT03_9BIFI|nr:TetR/AcrR family transcriptional regulator [Bifidobacterium pullorum]KFI61903.1 TetR family transcriptional regulator [Bifidobacterium pullorum subsp. gallinarum]MBM6692854.1 TetR/AcrR family transcriptional regulator [Bifidobacterium pullorum subsp. saeculare]